MNKVISLCFRITSGLDWNIIKSSEYSFVYEDPYMKVKFNEPVDYDDRKFLEIENKIRSAYFVQQVFDDRRYSLDYAGFEVEFHGFPHMINWASPAAIRQDSNHDILSALTGEKVFEFENERSKKDEWIDIISDNMNADSRVAGLVKSFADALSNSENEFIYLFEVLDALDRHFRGIDNACATLDLDCARWRRVVGILNHREYYQSRHRGQAFGGTKWAPSEKIWEARNFTKETIIKYILYKQNNRIDG